MNKAELVEALTTRIGDRRTAAAAVDGLVEVIVETVGAGRSVTLTGFGVFEPRRRAARVARNPRTGETVPVPETVVPSFRPGAAFRDQIGRSKEAAAGATSAPRRSPRNGVAAVDAAPAARSRSASGTATKAAPRSRAGTAAKATPKATAKPAARTSAAKTAAKGTAAKSAATKSTAGRTTTPKAAAAKTAAAKPATARTTAAKAASAGTTAAKATATAKAPAKRAGRSKA